MDNATSAVLITAAMIFSLCLAVLIEEFLLGKVFRFVFNRTLAPIAPSQPSAHDQRRACFGSRRD
jgi:hypothetical protein